MLHLEDMCRVVSRESPQGLMPSCITGPACSQQPVSMRRAVGRGSGVEWCLRLHMSRDEPTFLPAWAAGGGRGCVDSPAMTRRTTSAHASCSTAAPDSPAR